MEKWRERGYVPDSDEEDEETQESIGLIQTIKGPIDEIPFTSLSRENHKDERIEGLPGDQGVQSPPDLQLFTRQQSLTNSLRDTREPDDDPLQDQPVALSLPDATNKESDNAQDQGGSNSKELSEPPSSPDELQFDEHLFARFFPTTPVVKPTPPPDDNGNAASSKSTPLSSPPSTLVSPWSGRGSDVGPRQKSPAPSRPTVNEDTAALDDFRDAMIFRQNRSLRQRNAIQLHPYLLENAQYQNLLKARGLQPVRINIADNARRKDLNESQNQPYQDENAPPSSSPDVSFELPVSSPELLLSQPQPQTVPSHSAPLQPRTSANKYSGRKYGSSELVRNSNLLSGNKRRKISHGHTGNSTDQGNQVRQSIVVAIDNSNIRSHDKNIFDIPPSPPPSGGPSSALSTRTHRRLALTSTSRDPTPAPVATPTTDSRPKLSSALSILDLSDSESNVDEATEQDDADSASQTSDRSSAELRNMRRRIKGVLPASWLRLDLQQSEQRAKNLQEKDKMNSAHRPRENAKGVARKVERKRNDRNNMDFPKATAFLESDSTESDVEYLGSTNSNNALTTPAKKLNTLESVLAGLLDDDDIPEDNRIDYMYPSRPRRPKASGHRPAKRKKKENSGNSAFIVPRDHNHKSKRQTRLTDTGANGNQRRKPTSRSQVPKLGILDAPDFSTLSPNLRPQFLRVAARCARERCDNARQSPSRKFFRLGTRNDTQDINKTLHEWREGTIPPKVTNGPVGNVNPRYFGSGSANRPRLSISEAYKDAMTSHDAPMIGASGSNVDIEETVKPYEATEIVDLTDCQQNTNSPRSRTSSKPHVRQSRLARHGFTVSSLKRSVPRTVESSNRIDLSFNHEQSSSSFQKRLSTLNADYRHSQKNRRLPLARFLSLNARRLQNAAPSMNPDQLSRSNIQLSSTTPRTQPNRRPRKRQPQRIDFEAIEYRQPFEPVFDEAHSGSAVSVEISGRRTLKGLQQTVHLLTIDFDTYPLQIGTYFHGSSFIGSGEFLQTLDLPSRNLDQGWGHSVIEKGGHVYRWGAWNDTISSELVALLENIVSFPRNADSTADSPTSISLLKSDRLQLCRSIILYVSGKLSFSDPVDRKHFVERLLSALSNMQDVSQLEKLGSQEQQDLGYNIRIEMFKLILANQVRQIASHELVPPSKLSDANNAVSTFAGRIFRAVLSPSGISGIRHFLEDNKRLKKREAGIRQEYPVVEAYLVTRNIIDSQSQSPGFSDLFSKSLWSLAVQKNLDEIRDMESIWRSIFSVLPLHEFDNLGIFHPGLRFKVRQGHWHIVTQLISKVFEVYNTDNKGQGSLFDKYLKVLFHRCFHLLKSWAWQNCKPILETIFDFFAKISFHNLENEEAYGSPSFLDDMDESPVIDVESKDTCFHIFLKLVGTYLRSMDVANDTKKIRNSVWRLLPNHGRSYPKDQPLREKDLNALRNNHDLLCTLYWAAPKVCRPLLETVRRLVPPATSHKEACTINIQAWSRLVKVKLLSDDDTLELREFAKWHSDFTIEILKQHSLARTELEHAAAAASTFTHQSVERAISNNQRQIESLINSALSGMKRALRAASSMSCGMILIEKLPIEKLFGLFNPSIRRINGLVCQTLELLQIYAAIGTASTQKSQASVYPNDDSQDYGDWTGFEEIYDQQLPTKDPCIEHLETNIRPVLFRFISRIFGEDQVPDDLVLTKAIDTWVGVAGVLVNHRLRQWSSYVSLYDGDSWTSLRTTDQTRRFTPYFLASIIQKDPGAMSDCKFRIYTYWIESLVERGSMLKFQHKLTSAILNGCENEPLIRNLPFSADPASRKFNISLDEFCQRRLSLLSCLLSNMREHVAEIEGSNQRNMALTVEYSEMVRSLMAAMRRNYQELGSSTGSHYSAYVEFVHRVVEFLQQHSQNICPIDEFFMDSGAFPLPASDPTYVVATLKSYDVRLSVTKTAKQLVIFIQNISGRAALDGNQICLVDQIYKAMDHTYREQDFQRPFLRSFLLECVFPVYIENALVSPAGWILARPLLQSTTRVFMDILLDMNTANDRITSRVVESMLTYFDSLNRCLQLLTDHQGLLEEPSVLLTLISILETIIASLTLIDYLYRSSDKADQLVHYVDYFKEFFFFAVSTLYDPSAARTPDIELALSAPSSMPESFGVIREYARHQLQTWLKNDWSCRHGDYLVRRGMQSKAVVVNPECVSGEAAKIGFVTTVEVFFGVLDGLETFSPTVR